MNINPWMQSRPAPFPVTQSNPSQITSITWKLILFKRISGTRLMAKSSPKLSARDYKLLAEFRYQLRRFLRFSEEAGSAAGLTPQQYQALLAIKGFPGKESVTMGELRERLQLQSHSVVGLVNRLAAKRLVVRQTSRIDRRRVHIRLTPQGAKLLESVAAEHREQLCRIGPKLRSIVRAVCHKNSSNASLFET
jgi:DNA-binding MarR family transcriptional regulator